jgi:hypothetical protein
MHPSFPFLSAAKLIILPKLGLFRTFDLSVLSLELAQYEIKECL